MPKNKSNNKKKPQPSEEEANVVPEIHQDESPETKEPSEAIEATEANLDEKSTQPMEEK